ncbi:GntR family transcriptional regulator [Gracilibacillus halotolerans]|uniref:GntR family transcriptional regulator n=1 Tax=Gracilibacillus halotolerans TaxID=74386 RepID=A0A841RJ96_9BACI|nr:GntR family transcriptional regulator [Gracilibacillus halotolerans]MBB6511265.1 GntR family transcriptional regulator [Gracilibacillus halotolerans]
MIELDLRSRQPIYEQLVEKLKQLIIHRVLKQDEKLPSVRALAQQLSINPNTIQKAYRELEAQGYIYSVKGKGSFVNNMEEIDNQSDVRRLKEQLRKLISEAIFLGLTKQELMSLIQESVEDQNGGDHNHD